MFEPEFNHNEMLTWKAVGIPEEQMKLIRQFKVDYGLKKVEANSASEIVEYYWSRIPEELKVEPFFAFYIGVFINYISNNKDADIELFLN